MQYLTETSWEQLKKYFPQAYNFLLGCNIINEYHSLQKEFESLRYQCNDEAMKRKKWISSRLHNIEQCIPDIKNAGNAV